jgi:hypothetical protein
MSKLTKILLILISIILIIAVSFFLIGYLNPQNAGLSIGTTPISTVYIDGTLMGKTPYELVRKPGEIEVKLVPEITDKQLVSYEVKVKLNSGIRTIITREFGETDENSSGSVISFEKTGGDEAQIAVVSIPDEASVAIDGLARGFSPIKISSLIPGEHQLVISKTGCQEKTLSVKTIAGYKLTAIVKLAVSQEAPKEETPAEIKKPVMVEILSTPNGFLRVRSAASVNSSEVARVNPGDQFLLIQEDSESGWFEIEYQSETATSSAKLGWVSNQYSKKIETTTGLPD